jgi:hypothetical protein
MANKDVYSGFEYYYYTPSKVGAAIMCAIFFLTTVPQLFFLIKRRTWYMIPFLVGVICKFLVLLDSHPSIFSRHGCLKPCPWCQFVLETLPSPPETPPPKHTRHNDHDTNNNNNTITTK